MKPKHLSPTRPGLRVGCWPAAALAVLSLGTGSGAAMPSTASPLDPDWIRSIEDMTTQQARQAFQARLGPQAQVDVDITVGRLDPRLRLAPCPRTSVGFEGSYRPWGPTRITVRCLQGPVSWRVSVPLQVKVMAPALALKSALPAGTTLRAEHLAWQQADWADPQGPWLLDPQTGLGRPLRQAMAAGQPLKAHDFQPRVWFESGDTVQLHVQGSGFKVQGQGVAMGRGLENSPVRVRLDNGKTLVGTATGLRQVSVLL